MYIIGLYTYTYYIHIIYILYTYYIHIIYILYTYYIHIIYILYTYTVINHISDVETAACSDHLIPRSPSVAVLAVCSSWGAARAARTTRDPKLCGDLYSGMVHQCLSCRKNEQ